MSVDELQKLLNQEIPLSSNMKVTLLEVNDDELILRLPLSPNINHKGTIFGGSLYAASAIACYGLFLFCIRDRGYWTQNIVIADGDIQYVAPATQDVKVIASWPGEIEKSGFFSTLEKKGKGRIEMKAHIYCDKTEVCKFQGRFVAFK